MGCIKSGQFYLHRFFIVLKNRVLSFGMALNRVVM